MVVGISVVKGTVTANVVLICEYIFGCAVVVEGTMMGSVMMEGPY